MWLVISLITAIFLSTKYCDFEYHFPLPNTSSFHESIKKIQKTVCSFVNSQTSAAKNLQRLDPLSRDIGTVRSNFRRHLRLFLRRCDLFFDVGLLPGLLAIWKEIVGMDFVGEQTQWCLKKNMEPSSEPNMEVKLSMAPDKTNRLSVSKYG